MTQIFIIGSSSVYGVGANNGSWADLIKQHVHAKMYGDHPLGEAIEVFNFGKSGEKIEFATKLFPVVLELFGRKGKIITIISIGSNNAKAENEPDNFVTSLEVYQSEMEQLLDAVQAKSDFVLAVGSGFVDERKTNPKISPLSGRKSFFTNERRKLFENRWKTLCEQRNINFVGVELPEQTWVQEYLYEDGLHPNQKGYQYIADRVLEKIEGEILQRSRME